MLAQLEALKGILDYIPVSFSKTVPLPPPVIYKPAMSYVVRIAGVSGALAVGLGAYGSHVVLRSPSVPKERKRSLKTSSKYHFFHTLAILAAPKAKYPIATASLFACGMLLFCGPCYHYAIQGSDTVKALTPFGGIMLILGWLSFVL
ncbi:unnamed protein product [Auanema sp. JU1783]|nr:unnamed protein product [Auanema sp. JU1783]